MLLPNTVTYIHPDSTHVIFSWPGLGQHIQNQPVVRLNCRLCWKAFRPTACRRRYDCYPPEPILSQRSAAVRQPLPLGLLPAALGADLVLDLCIARPTFFQCLIFQSQRYRRRRHISHFCCGPLFSFASLESPSSNTQMATGSLEGGCGYTN